GRLVGAAEGSEARPGLRRVDQAGRGEPGSGHAALLEKVSSCLQVSRLWDAWSVRGDAWWDRRSAALPGQCGERTFCATDRANDIWKRRMPVAITVRLVSRVQ